MKTRRLLTVLLTVALAIVLLAVGVSAAEIVDSGTCGDNLTWALDSEGVLTISGKGMMENYDPYDENQDDEYEGYSAPWESMSDSVQQLVITSGVTGIGNYAFLDCSNMTSITFPASLTRIGASAFQNCESLTTVKIPDSVTSIGDYAFAGCVNLTSVNIPKGLTHLSSVMFYNCRSLTKITIPDSVTSIGSGVFGFCSSLTEVKIPESVTEMGSTVFRNCSNLTSVNIPKGITKIGGSLFERCSSLTSLTIPESVTSIDMYAFAGCTGLTSLNIPAGVTQIGDAAFSGCRGLTNIVIPEGVRAIPRESFEGCGMSSITIPAGVTEIGENAFSRCDNLQTIIFEGNAPTFGETSFAEITATAYYPVDDDSWTEAVMQDYDGELTWVEYQIDNSLKILEQPKAGYAKFGGTAKITVKAQGEGLKYQWYIKNAGQSKYSKSSVTTPTYSCKLTEKTKDRKVYCVITDSNGESVKTKTTIVREAVSITKQPKDIQTQSGNTVKVTVKASGDGLKYQWYVKNAGEAKFTKSSVTKATYSTKMREAAQGRQIYCVVTDAYGKTVKTQTITLGMTVSITRQPTSVVVEEGQSAKVSFKAVGDGLTYTWYFSDVDDAKFKKTSTFTGNTYSVKMTDARNGRLIYCVVTDAYGNKVSTDIVSLTMK